MGESGSTLVGDVNRLLRGLPKVDDVLRSSSVEPLRSGYPRWAVVAAIRDEIASLRARVLEGVKRGVQVEMTLSGDALLVRVQELVRPSLVRVLNATGVVLHTNLGRAPLSARAIARVVEVASGYSNLEYRLDERRRGSRHEHVADLLCALTGAEAALVVNNNAAAVLLALATLAAGREVIVSRGELVEIGGSFRIPDVMRASGVRLVEVGTTNRTHVRDYERAITPNTGLLLKVHQSNFAQVGFTAEVSVEELVAIGRAHQLPTMVDLGSGSLVPTSALGLGKEPSVMELVAAGADVITFSGDKLLGGPQAGLLLSTARHVDTLRSHPLLRAVRPDKMTLAALSATLEEYRDARDHEEAPLGSSAIPALAMLSAAPEALRRRAEQLANAIRSSAPAMALDVIEVRSAVGGGALPLSEPPSWAVAMAHPHVDVIELDNRLRAGDPPLVGRIVDDRLVADVRTLRDDEISVAAHAVAKVAY